MNEMTEAQASALYVILVEECGASNRALEIAEFVRYMTADDRKKEFRFCGSLGFGGKLYQQNGEMPYVNCYTEDLNQMRRAAINRANERIRKLFAKE